MRVVQTIIPHQIIPGEKEVDDKSQELSKLTKKKGPHLE